MKFHQEQPLAALAGTTAPIMSVGPETMDEGLYTSAGNALGCLLPNMKGEAI